MPALQISNWTDTTDPYVAPTLARSALVIVDTQVDFVDGGASPIEGTTEILPNLAKLLGAYRSHGLPVIHVIRLYEGDDVDLVRRRSIESGVAIVRPGSEGSQIAPELRLPDSAGLDPIKLLAGEFQSLGPNEVAMWKPRWSAFHRTRLHDHLVKMEVDSIVFGGCNFPNCPRASIYDASELDYRVLVASDALSGLNPLHLDEIERLGVVHAPTELIIKRMSGLGSRH